MPNDAVGAGLALLLLAASAQAQVGQPSAGVVEQLALRAAVESVVGRIVPNLRIVVDPALAKPNEAPAGSTGTTRTASRNAALQSGGARLGSGASVIDCTVRPCVLRGADVYVTLSEPAFVGNESVVTVTTLKSSKRGLDYRTVNVNLMSDGSRWRVISIVELGVS